ncbi:MAG: hypothetical protein RMX97_31255 [Nostoc sp. DedQUE11]|nr:hypothetical protein [Nostoc sp. DedQUE11]
MMVGCRNPSCGSEKLIRWAIAANNVMNKYSKKNLAHCHVTNAIAPQIIKQKHPVKLILTLAFLTTAELRIELTFI